MKEEKDTLLEKAGNFIDNLYTKKEEKLIDKVDAKLKIALDKYALAEYKLNFDNVEMDIVDLTIKTEKIDILARAGNIPGEKGTVFLAASIRDNEKKEFIGGIAEPKENDKLIPRETHSIIKTKKESMEFLKKIETALDSIIDFEKEKNVPSLSDILEKEGKNIEKALNIKKKEEERTKKMESVLESVSEKKNEKKIVKKKEAGLEL